MSRADNSSAVRQSVSNAPSGASDTDYLTTTLSTLARVPTDVSLGFDTLMEPDDPKLVTYVQKVLRPALMAVGVKELIEAPPNNLVVGLGAGSLDRTLLIENYTPAQHHNLMADPWSGRVGHEVQASGDGPDGRSGRVVYGQGVSQAKAHQAVMLAVLRRLVRDGPSLRGRLYWAINNEGRSSHACTEAILHALAGGPKPNFAIVQVNTDLGISLGNRGRVDIDIHLSGRSTHSSDPSAGHSAIEGVRRLLNRIEALEVGGEHPLLGRRQLVPYKIEFQPLAPHTIPGDASLTLDLRLLPGDDPQAAAREVITQIADLAPWTIDARPGVFMLPALVDPQQQWVRELQRSAIATYGAELREYHALGAFDAGGLCHANIPAVMFGAGRTRASLDVDMVSIGAVEREAAILHRLIVNTLQ